MSIAKLCHRQVHQAEPGEKVSAAAARMRQHNVGTLLVLDAERKPVGIVTDRDLALRVLGEGRDPARTRVADVMTGHPSTLHLETPLDAALSAMQRLGVRRMPVVGARGVVAGMVSVDDLLAALVPQLTDLCRVLAHSGAGNSALLPLPDLAGLERTLSDPEC